MVLRRSTTDWTWPRLFSSVARSIVAFMFVMPHQPTRVAHHYSEPFRARKWDDGAKGDIFVPAERPDYALAGISTASTW